MQCLAVLHLFCFLSRIFSSLSDMPTFQTSAILSYFCWLIHVSHPSESVDNTAFIIIFLVFILMCCAVIVFSMELNALLAI